MQKRTTFLPVFLIFLFLIGSIFLFSQTKIANGIGGFFEFLTVPIQRFTFDIFNPSNKSTEDKLREENIKLTAEFVKMKEIEKENKALHDQFVISNPSSQNLLPAKIIGRHVDEIIVDKGRNDGMKVGQVVVVKNNFVGVVTNVSANRSVIRFLMSNKISFTAKTSKTEANGVVNGKGENEIVLDKVVLSEKLEKEDLVVTKGDIDSNGNGYPPGLVVGKIISVNKKASSLFQQAEVRSLVDFSKLNTVFVFLQQ